MPAQAAILSCVWGLASALIVGLAALVFTIVVASRASTKSKS